MSSKETKLKYECTISPIFYMGNKKKLIQKGLINFFPKKIHTFVDLFSGSAIVSMNVNASQYIINDLEHNLIRLYCMFKNNLDDKIISHVEDRIDKYGLARERSKRNEFKDKVKLETYKQAYRNFRSDYNSSDIKNTLDFYTLMFYSFSQQFRFNNKGDFNMPCGNDCFSDKNKEYIRNGCNFFSKNNVYICNKDFGELKPDKLKKNDFVYLDPPYMNTTATYNENGGWSEKDELRLHNLCEQLNKQQIKFALSNVFLNKGIENKQLIDWVKENKFNVHYFNNFNYMACGKGNAKTVEVLITNY